MSLFLFVSHSQVLDPNPLAGLTVSPVHGVVPVGGSTEIRVALTPDAIMKFDTRVQVSIRGGKSIELRIGGTVEAPDVNIDVVGTWLAGCGGDGWDFGDDMRLGGFIVFFLVGWGNGGWGLWEFKIIFLFLRLWVWSLCHFHNCFCFCFYFCSVDNIITYNSFYLHIILTAWFISLI